MKPFIKLLETKAYWLRFFIMFAGIVLVTNFYNFLCVCYSAWRMYYYSMNVITISAIDLHIGDFGQTILEQITYFLIYILMAAMGAANGPHGSEE
jgi:uncharacterized membrane protein